MQWVKRTASLKKIMVTNKQTKNTTRGWEFLFELKDSSQDWISLKKMKDSNPLETAEFTVTCDIHTELVFAWWVEGVLKTQK